ncbi:MAG TPA: hypothetical protein VK465_05740, partial [Fibrobacteria bacterium]|nr:hypothetical protein [Fibrobacteria bacterium]
DFNPIREDTMGPLDSRPAPEQDLDEVGIVILLFLAIEEQLDHLTGGLQGLLAGHGLESAYGSAVNLAIPDVPTKTVRRESEEEEEG